MSQAGRFSPRYPRSPRAAGWTTITRFSGEVSILAWGRFLGNHRSAYFFERLTNGVWVQGAKLLPSGSIGTAEFGGSVSLSGGLALVGAAHAPGNGLGSAYVFKLPPSWTDVGFSLSGMAGEPSLVGSGSLLPGSAGAITLSDAAPSSPALLFLSLATTPTPFKCGTLVPVPPAAQISVVTGGGGSITLEWTTWPGGLSGANLSLQYAIQDVTAVCGVALSNALTAELP